MLKVEKASVTYGKATVLREVSLLVNAGEIVTLIGANGAGKTTLMNAVSGMVPLKTGEIRLGDVKLSGLPPHRTVRLGIGYVPEGRQIFGSMTVLDNLTMGSYSQFTGPGLGPYDTRAGLSVVTQPGPIWRWCSSSFLCSGSERVNKRVA